jgi:hypothetical protein
VLHAGIAPRKAITVHGEHAENAFIPRRVESWKVGAGSWELGAAPAGSRKSERNARISLKKRGSIRIRKGKAQPRGSTSDGCEARACVTLFLAPRPYPVLSNHPASQATQRRHPISLYKTRAQAQAQSQAQPKDAMTMFRMLRPRPCGHWMTAVSRQSYRGTPDSSFMLVRASPWSLQRRGNSPLWTSSAARGLGRPSVRYVYLSQRVLDKV